MAGAVLGGIAGKTRAVGEGEGLKGENKIEKQWAPRAMKSG
jgi:hypothetical protein